MQYLHSGGNAEFASLGKCKICYFAKWRFLHSGGKADFTLRIPAGRICPP